MTTNDFINDFINDSTIDYVITDWIITVVMMTDTSFNLSLQQ